MKSEDFYITWYDNSGCSDSLGIGIEGEFSYESALKIAKQELLYHSEPDCCKTDRVILHRYSDDFVLWDSEHPEVLKFYEEFSADRWQCSSGISRTVSDKPSVYIDVDGTAAYWHSDGKGLSYPEQILDWRYHYYLNLESHIFIVDLAEQLVNKGYDVCILSATGRECFADRFEWIKNNMPFISTENIFLCPIGADKNDFCKGNAHKSILIDDYEENLNQWRGMALKSLNSVNSPSASHETIPTRDYERLAETNATLYDMNLQSSVEYIESRLKELDVNLRINQNKKDNKELL